MKCFMCGSNTAEKVTKLRQARYKDETVLVLDEFYRCPSCKEEFVTPEQMNAHARLVKNEIRKKSGLLAPERITAIRKKLELTQDALEKLLGTGPKVVVRWESGKVIQGGGHDMTLRLLERDPKALRDLRTIQQDRAKEQQKYEKAHKASGMAAGQGD